MLDLVRRALDKQGILSENQCRLIWEGAFQIGKRLKSRKLEDADLGTIRKASSFENKVYDFILKNVSP
jgi:hypothetical protein